MADDLDSLRIALLEAQQELHSSHRFNLTSDSELQLQRFESESSPHQAELNRFTANVANQDGQCRQISLYEELTIATRLQECLGLNIQEDGEADEFFQGISEPPPESECQDQVGIAATRKRLVPFKNQGKFSLNTATANAAAAGEGDHDHGEAEEVALALLADSIGLEVYYLSPFVRLTLYPSEKQLHSHISRYFVQSQCHMTKFQMKLRTIFKVTRFAEVKLKYVDDQGGNGKRKGQQQIESTRMLLWHGTDIAGVLGILRHGFVRPTSEGQMYGTGTYFADRASKSAQYCGPALPGHTGYLFLCDVQLGSRTYETTKAEHRLKVPPTRCTSVKGVGRCAPAPEGNIIHRGVLIPAGRTVPAPTMAVVAAAAAAGGDGGFSLEFNEYIVYDTDLVNVSFLVEFEYI